MKKIILYFTMCAAATLLFMRFNVKSLTSEAGEKEQDGGAIAGSEYWNKMRVNPNTGKVDPADEIKAMLAVEKFDKANNTRSSVPSINWNFRGPDNVGGRTRAILFDRKTGNIFAGGVSGGLWISKDGGNTFQGWSGNTSDTVQAITVASICQAANGDIYFGTGEGQYYNDGQGTGGFPGGGIWKSTDGGATFNLLANTKPTLNNTSSFFEHVNRMVASPKRAGVIYAGTNRGVFKSIDSGTTWHQIKRNVGTSNNEITDLEISADDQYVYACTENTTGCQIFRGKSNNNTVDTLIALLPGTSLSGRLECAVSHDSANYIYLSQVNSADGSLNKVWQSTDFGTHWTTIGTGTGYDPKNALAFDPLGNQGDYDMTMEVVPGYKDVLYLGGQLELWRWSASNGWEKVSGYSSNSYYIHPDMHFIAFNPLHPNTMLLGCDGGLYKSSNANINPSTGSPTFQVINHSYSVTQQYSCATNATGTQVMGGAQDNGTHLVDGSGYTIYSGKSVGGGDGGKCEISQYDNNVMFEAYVSSENGGQSGGFVTRSISGGNSFSSVWDKRTDAKDGVGGGPNGGLDDGANFVAPYLLWEGNYPSPWTYNDTSFLAIGSNSGTVWVSPWATNRSAPMKWFRLQSNGQYQASSIAASSDGNYLFVGYANGSVIRYSGLKDVFRKGRWHYPNDTSHADTWNATDSGITMTAIVAPGSQYVTGIAVDFNNPNHVVISLGNYSYTNFIFQSKNATSISPTFSSIQGTGASAIPAMPIYSCCIDAADTNVIMAGTEMGIYISADGGSTWVHKSQGMGNLPITAIRQFFQNGTWNTFVATHGHGIYSTGLWTGTNDIYGHAQNIATGMVYPNPSNTKAIVHFHTIRDAAYSLNVYDLSGNLVYTQSAQHYTAGDNNTTIPVSGLSNGLYIAQLRSGADARSFKLTVLH